MPLMWAVLWTHGRCRWIIHWYTCMYKMDNWWRHKQDSLQTTMSPIQENTNHHLGKSTTKYPSLPLLCVKGPSHGW